MDILTHFVKLDLFWSLFWDGLYALFNGLAPVSMDVDSLYVFLKNKSRGKSPSEFITQIRFIFLSFSWGEGRDIATVIPRKANIKNIRKPEYGEVNRITGSCDQ